MPGHEGEDDGAARGFGVRLKRLRLAAGLSQTALASAAGLHWRTVMDYEQGVKGDPRLSTLRKLAGALGVGIEDLGGAGPEGGAGGSS